MKINSLYKITGASLMALGMTVAPISSGLVSAQDESPTMENGAPAIQQPQEDTAGQNFQDAQESLERAGQETIQGVEAAGEAAQQQAQEAAQNAQQAAERAEQAAVEAIEMAQQGFEWGWLGLLGLIGLFGLAGGKKRRVEVDERYHQPTTTTGDYR